MEVSADQLKKILVEPGFVTEANFESAKKEGIDNLFNRIIIVVYD